MNDHQLLVIGPNGDDTYYVGELGAGFRLAKRDRTVKMDYTQGAWTVEFLDHPDDPTSVAEWGKDPILEVALRYALGAMLGPIDSEYDADALAQALAAVDEDPELADHLNNYGQGTYALHYTSADAAGPDATWSVYREQYPTPMCDVPIDGSTVKVSTHPNEQEAEAEADRLQRSVIPQRLTILANSDVTRGKYAAAAVHAALNHYGIPHGAVIVLGARAHQIEEQCDGVIRDAGRTEVRPGTVTAGIRRTGGSDV